MKQDELSPTSETLALSLAGLSYFEASARGQTPHLEVVLRLWLMNGLVKAISRTSNPMILIGGPTT